jgi:hypothetical protein
LGSRWFQAGRGLTDDLDKKEKSHDGGKQNVAWHGWGSPVGLAIFLIGLGASAVLVRIDLVCI